MAKAIEGTGSICREEWPAAFSQISPAHPRSVVLANLGFSEHPGHTHVVNGMRPSTRARATCVRGRVGAMGQLATGCSIGVKIGMRRLAGRAVQRVVAQVDGSPVLVHNLASYYYDARPLDPVGSRDGGNGDLTGFRVWEAAPHLIEFLDTQRSLVQNRSVLELGAGTGAVGLAAAAFGARQVVLSDADSTATLAGEHGWEERSRLATLADNVQLNGERAAAVSVEALRWGDEEHIAALASRHPMGFQTIVASDVLYSLRMYDALATTIRALSAADAVAVFSYPERHGDEETFVQQLAPDFQMINLHTAEAQKPLRVMVLERTAQ